jgi:hypothetical protein
VKVGDMVKHPQGIDNVCKDIYSCGLILESHLAGFGDNQAMHHLVWWCDEVGPMVYSENNLEVINETI